MKQSSTEPPKKKLKQARLPFQILSPGVVKNCELSPSCQGKRKACETPSDEDVVVSEINEVTPVEKKAKVVTKLKDEEKSDLKIVENESEDGGMEVDEKEDGNTRVVAFKENSKTPSNSNKKVGKTVSSRKTYGKRANKSVGKESEKTEEKNTNTKPEVVDIIDLCNSPAKVPNKNKESTSTVPRCGETSPLKNKKKEIQSVEHSESESISQPSSGNLEDLSAANEVDESKDNSDKESEHCKSQVSSNESKSVPKLKLTECSSEEKKNSESCAPNKNNEISNDERSTKPKVDENNTDNKSACTKILKKASLTGLVTSKSPQNNSENSLNSINREGNNDNEDNIMESSPRDNINNILSSKTEASPDSPDRGSQSALDDSILKTPSTANDSLSKVDSSSSDCNTSMSSTPASSAKKTLSTPRRMTPKQLLKLKEKDEKRKEKERLKQEKEKKRAEEKEEKLKMKKEKEEERLRLKLEKEEEKRKEKEEKDKKKQAELDQKNEEKRLKEEEKRLKEDEKRAKEEEKRKKEEEERKKKEEKRLREEQKEAEKRKSAQAFASFFVKSENKSAADEDKEDAPIESIFQPFEVKNDMRLAPVLRVQLPQERKQCLETILECSEVDSGQRLYLEDIRSPSYVRGSDSRTWPPPDETDDEVIIIESENPNDEMEIDKGEPEKKPEKKIRRAKLLQFHENRRPPYWGTWQKKSKHIRPRAPLNQDKKVFEYDVDSDDEWEEPVDGESLRGSEDEESQDEQYEEDNDMFVPHGYLSDGEGEDELDDQSPETMKARLKLLQIEFEAERNEKQEKLKPRLIGCVWFCNSESDPSSVGSYISELFLSRKAVWEGSLPVTVYSPAPPSPTTPVDAVDNPGDETKVGPKKKLVPESMIPDIIRKVHGNRRKLSKLMMEILEEQQEVEMRPSKNCLAKKIREFASWVRSAETGHHCWYVKDEVRQAYGLTDLQIQPSVPTAPLVPPSPSSTTSITKFTKVLTTDERLRLLRESPSGNNTAKEVSKTAADSKSLTPNAKTPSIKLATPSPVVKKRVSLITVGPKESPSPNSIMNFITKPAKENATSSTDQKKELAKTDEKVIKRITPITLTSAVTKPTTIPPSSEDDCIVIGD